MIPKELVEEIISYNVPFYLEDAIRLNYSLDYIRQLHTFNVDDAFIYACKYGNINLAQSLLPNVHLQSYANNIFENSDLSDFSVFATALAEAIISQEDNTVFFLLDLDIPLTFHEFNALYFLREEYSEALEYPYANELNQNELNVMLEESIGLGHLRQVHFWIGLGAHSSLMGSEDEI
jgi:hypothetical protein